MALTGLWSRVTGAIVGVAVGGAAGRAVEPVFEGIRQESWHDNPNRVLPLDALAELVATAVTDFDSAAGEAQRSGYLPNRFQAAVQLALRAPTIAQAFDMRRRGEISDEQLRHAFRKAGLEPQYDTAAFELVNVLPSVTDMVRMAVREVYDPAARDRLDLDAEFPGAFAADAERIGIDRETAGKYWAAHWELPSYEQGAEMLFRGELSPGEFSGLLKALDYAPTWRGKLEAIARRIPTLPDMVRMALREVWTPSVRDRFGLDNEYPARFTLEAAKHGLTEEYARDYWAAHWELPSVTQGFTMRHRDALSDDELDTLLKAKDVMPFFRDKLRAITYLVPGRVDLRRMLRAEVLTEAEVQAGYERLGYAPADAATLTAFAVAERDGTDVGVAALRVYRRRVIQRANAEYVSWQLTPSEVRSALTGLGIKRATVDELLRLWEAERALVRAPLSPAQIRAAFQRRRLNRTEALARLREHGYTEADGLLFLGVGVPAATAAEIRRAYSRAVIAYPQAVAELEARGFTADEAASYLAETRPELSAKDIRDALGAKQLTEPQALERMLALGYTEEDARIFLASG